MKPLLLTFDDQRVFGQIATDHAPRHQTYAERQGYDFVVEHVRHPIDYLWLKVSLILKYLQAGRHSHVFWIGVDALVANLESDMREALPDWSWMALTIHPHGWHRDVIHFQTGVMYVRACPTAIEFFTEVVGRQGEPGHQEQWNEQACINSLLLDNPRWQSGLNVLRHIWNNNVPDQPLGNEIVAAWHGVSDAEERRTKMLAYASDHVYSGALRSAVVMEARPLFLTIDDGRTYGGMIADHRSRHLDFCAKFGYDYLAEDGASVNYLWSKVIFILKHLRRGLHSHVFWMDADVMVSRFDRDMRDALPDWAWLGLTVHPYGWQKNVVHFQTGVLYVKSNQEALDFFSRVVSRRDESHSPHEWNEQTCINDLLLCEPRWQAGLNVLPHIWNNNLHDQPVGNEIVAAWHGAGSAEERRARMRQYAAEHPYTRASDKATG